MSYCRKEGKDIIIFATEEDLSGPSKTELLPDDPNEMDSSSQGAILPNGEINWDCPCLGNLPNGPCGPSFREAFTCWAENRDDHDSFAEKCFDNFTTWEECLAENRHIYKSSKRDDDEEKEVEGGNLTQVIKESETMNETESVEHSVPQSAITSERESRPAIAAAYVEESPE